MPCYVVAAARRASPAALSARPGGRTCGGPGALAALAALAALLGLAPQVLRLESQVDSEHRLLEKVTSVLTHHGVDQPEPHQGRAIRRQLLGRRTPLHRHQGAPRLEQGD